MTQRAMAMMKQMCGDMKMSLKLAVEPGIGETNATHREGNTITLMEMNMGKIVENPDAMKKLGKMDPKQDPTVAMEALKGIDGIKVEAQKEVTVTGQVRSPFESAHAGRLTVLRRFEIY